MLKKGEPKTCFKSADSGNRIVHAFCPDCGTPIYSAVPGEPRGHSLRVGTLDRRAELVPSRQIWWRSALPWTSDLNPHSPDDAVIMSAFNIRPSWDQCLSELVEPCAEATWRAGGELSPWRDQ